VTARCDEIRLSLGSYVLGALTAEETEQVRSHLAACAVCQVEHQELAGLPRMLARLTGEEFATEPPAVAPGAGLLDRILRQAAAERETAVIAATRTERDELAAARGQAVEAARTFAASNPATGISARVTATPTTWGNSVRVWFTGVPKGTWCHLVAVGEGGRQENASSWRADYGDQPQGKGEAVIPGAVGMPLDQITRFDIVTAAGEPLLSIPV
jgi:anti-sigma factor RsiW